MDISINSNDIVFRTPFSDKHDLLQIMRGIRPGTVFANEPVDFRLSGLQRKGHMDIWHIDIALSFATDEAAPPAINFDDGGANHSAPCGVRLNVPNHGMDYSDISSLWHDEAGNEWTLVRVEDPDNLMFVSQNVGTSKTHHKFLDRVIGTLTYVTCGTHTAPITPTSQSGHNQMHRSIRHTARDLFYYKDGQRHRITGYHTDCDSAEIIEQYEIINPATIAETLRKNRPAGGYFAPVDIAVGEPMVKFNFIHRILGDGTVLIEFDHHRVSDAIWSSYMGYMAQERCDVYDSGIYRYVPKLKPFEHNGVMYDLSDPINTSSDDFPDRCSLSRDRWESLSSPPDRQIDFIRKPGGSGFTDGDSAAAFASGFLPLYDGIPEVRAKNIHGTSPLIKSRKTYPGFISCFHPEDGGFPPKMDLENAPSLDHVHGIAYRKFFFPKSRTATSYTVDFDGITYLYMDFYKDGELTCKIPNGKTPKLTEASSTVSYTVTDSEITAKASKGYAIFELCSSK